MTMPLWILLTLTLTALTVMALGALGTLALRLRRRLDHQERLSAALERDIQALCAGARGMGDAIGRLDGRVRTVGQRQDELAQGTGDLSTYRRAIGLVQKGAGVRELIEHMGLEPGEAELVYRLHHPVAHEAQSRPH